MTSGMIEAPTFARGFREAISLVIAAVRAGIEFLWQSVATEWDAAIDGLTKDLADSRPRV